MRTVAILPVKRFPQAKQRLRDELPPPLRESLAEAMLGDVLEALTRVARVERVVVVTPSARAGELARGSRAVTVADSGAGHNAAAAIGIDAALTLGADRVLLVPGDCPALDPPELDALLELNTASPSVLIVPDRHGTGTNALLLDPPDVMAPSFGPESCVRHVAQAEALGVSCQVVHVPSLALDVDTREDLDALTQAGGHAPRTLELLAQC